MAARAAVKVATTISGERNTKRREAENSDGAISGRLTGVKGESAARCIVAR